MYSRLIEEYLEALRPDSPNGLREAFNRNGDESGRPAGHRSTAILGIQNRPRDMSRPNTPVKSGSNAGLQTGTFHYPLYENAGQKSTDPTAFLQRLAQILGGTMSNVDKTLYFKNEVNGNSLTFRLANHRGNAKKFVKHGETSGNFGVVIKMSEKRFIPDKGTDYMEEVFFPDKLTDAKMAAIEQGVADWLSRGVYTGPKGDETNPRNPIHANPVNQSVPWQQPQQPPQQPAGAGMAESLATIYTRGNNMNYKMIAESAARALMELDGLTEDWEGNNSEQRRKKNFKRFDPEDIYWNWKRVDKPSHKWWNEKDMRTKSELATASTSALARLILSFARHRCENRGDYYSCAQAEEELARRADSGDEFAKHAVDVIRKVYDEEDEKKRQKEEAARIRRQQMEDEGYCENAPYVNAPYTESPGPYGTLTAYSIDWDD